MSKADPKAPQVSNFHDLRAQCIQYIQERAAWSLSDPARFEKFNRSFNDEKNENRTVVETFLDQVDRRSLLIYFQSSDKVVATIDIPKQIKRKAVYFLKSSNVTDPIRKVEELKQEIVCGEISESTLQSLSLLSHEVIYPLLSNPANRADWSGPTSKEVMLKFSAFLASLHMAVGQSKGQTLLPPPPPEAFDEDSIPQEKERVHLLETCVIQWHTKIQQVLSTDPEDKIKQGAQPDPLDEIDFWTAKARDLTSLNDQLKSERMRIVLDILRELKSPIGAQFSKVAAEVVVARDEAAENTRFLRILKQYFDKLRNAPEADFLKLEQLYVPMLHSMLLVWQHSATYSTQHRLSVLIQEICNGLVRQAEQYCSGDKVFRFITTENIPEAVTQLQKTSALLEKFKATFEQYQVKAASTLQGKDWTVAHEVVFHSLDTFLERCQDISEFVRIVQEFSKLEKLSLGGTKGKLLTDQLHLVHRDFVRAVEEFRAFPVDIMDINAHQFDDHYYNFRCQIKELERRVAAILLAGFDDCSTLEARFKLLDSFEGLLDRPIIKDELEKKCNTLLYMYNEDLQRVQALFHEMKDAPRTNNNLPPVAGALTWVRGLHARITAPLDRIKQLSATSSGSRLGRTSVLERKEKEQADSRAGATSRAGEDEDDEDEPIFSGRVTGEEVHEVERMQTAIARQIEAYEQQKVESWVEEVEANSEDKLQACLLRRDRDRRLLYVNFDEALVRLLREVKYLSSLGIPIPPTASRIYQKGEQYRQQMASLDQIVTMYNEMMETLHPVERPLVEKEIAHIDETIERGISKLNWNSPEVGEFIKESMATVKAVYATVRVMKDNLDAIKKMMTEYASQPLCERKNKPMSPADFEENLRKLWMGRHQIIAEHQERITKLLNETNAALKVNKASPIWRAYVEYAQEAVRDGLALTIVNSIRFLSDQLEPEKIEKHSLAPMLEVKLGLFAGDITFNAEEGPAAVQTPHQYGGSSTSGGVEEKAALGGLMAKKSRRDVWQMVADWVDGFFEIGNIMTRMDGSHYVGDLKKNEQIVRFVNMLKKLLDQNNKDCESFKQNEYSKYDFLWKAERQAEFKKFLDGALADRKAQREAERAEKEKRRAERSGGLAAMRSPRKDRKKEDEEESEPDKDDAFNEILPLDKFEQRILYYQELGREIQGKPRTIEIGWLRVDANLIKNQLANWVQKWIQTYTNFLYNDVTRKLYKLENLQKEVNAGLMEEVTQGDSAALKKVLGYIHMVRSVEESTKQMFGPMKDCVSLLKKYGRPLDDYELRLLAEAPKKWEETLENVNKVKDKVNKLQNEEVDKIKERVHDFEAELASFRKEFQANSPMHDYEVDVEEAYDAIYKYHQAISRLEQKSQKLNDLEKVFELPVSKHAEIKKTRQDNKLLKQLWDMVCIVRSQLNDWKKTPWDKIDTDSLLVASKNILKEIETMTGEMRTWRVYQSLVLEVKNLLVVLPLINQLHSPAMEDRHWDDLKAATGKQFDKDEKFCLADLLDLELHRFAGDVGSIVDQANKEAKIGQQLSKIESIWAEATLDFAAKNFVHGEESELPIGPDGKPELCPTAVFIISTPDELLGLLEEHMLLLQGMQSQMQGQAKSVEEYVRGAAHWLDTLTLGETVIRNWLEVQSKWLSLQAIFLGSADIKKQLPEDTERFLKVDAMWKELMSEARHQPIFIEACQAPGRKELLGEMEADLERCQRALHLYLETKRAAFPRFFFVANTVLEEILSKGTNPHAIQKHIGTCFDNLARLTFKEEEEKDGSKRPTNLAIAFHSKDGEETVEMKEPFACEGDVEVWLEGLVGAMRESLRDLLARAKSTADHWDITMEKPRHKWLFDYPAQIAMTASQIIWTEEVMSQFDAFADGNDQALKKYAEVMQLRLDALTQLVDDRTLSKRDRIKINTLITVDVHNRDVVDKLIAQKVTDAAAFAWQSQLRYHWKPETKDCVIKITDATFNYAYEYIGNTGRLVITPLTDRCYITLTQALRLTMGGAPAGPAGTGKTETTKDLGRVLALPVYVFNCTPQMNVDSMAAIFKGLAQTGAWGCFDEFNRIRSEVLSVISTQFASVLNALREKKTSFTFEDGDVIKVVPTLGCFITMNPDYAGRTTLPENLKALFRSCAMVVPDMDLICENMLLAEGFPPHSSKELSRKFTHLYQLSKELLSKQRHYDWGLRACKAVLNVAGSLKRAAPKGTSEDKVLMRALYDFNIPKIVVEDQPIFERLVEDLFPGMFERERPFDKSLQQAIVTCARDPLGLQRAAIQPEPSSLSVNVEKPQQGSVESKRASGKRMLGRQRSSIEITAGPDGSIPQTYVPGATGQKVISLHPVDGFVLKCVQLAELLQLRHSIFILGPAGCGKSEIWKTLLAALNMMGKSTVHEVINPKAIRNNELFGWLSKTDWHPGVLSTIMAQMSRNEGRFNASQFYKWIVLDGDIDPDWIESMNSVMDDSKLLTLASNDRIVFTSSMRLIFEIDSLRHATPATVSRAGIIYINTKDVNWMPFQEAWIEAREDESRERKSLLSSLFNKYCTEFHVSTMRSMYKRIVPLSEINMIKTLCFMLEGLLARQSAEKRARSRTEEKLDPIVEKEIFDANFVFAVIWAFGGAILADRKENPTLRDRFSDWWKATHQTVKFPKEGTVFDYFPHPKTGKMTPWALEVPAWEPTGRYMSRVVVPTADSIRTKYLMDLLVPRQRPILFVGTAGTGKTTLAADYLEELTGKDKSEYAFHTINLNYYTDAKALQRILESQLNETRVGKTFRPIGNKKLIYFIDDLNMPVEDKYGTQTPHALIRQHMDYGSWYDTNSLEKKDVRDVQYVACMNPTAGSFTIDERLQGQFATIAIQLPTFAVLQQIFGAILDNHFCNGKIPFHKSIQELKEPLIKATVELHDLIALKFLPSSQNFHYQFTLRDMYSIFQGLCQATPDRRYDPKMIARLWEHECTRVMADRLVTPAEVVMFDQYLQSKTKQYFRTITTSVEPSAGKDLRTVKEGEREDGPLVFTSFHVGHGYYPIGSMDNLRRILTVKLREYNETNAVMNLELFDMAMMHVARIVRIIEQPRGNALLVGVGGSGKQSLAKLASKICNYQIFQISVTQTYGMNELRADLQELYRKAGVKNMPITFLLTDTQIVDDEWLVYVNDLLSSGYIPDLFTNDEKDQIASSLRIEAKAHGVGDSREAMFDFFISRVRANLHVVLCFSPVGEKFRVRCRKFPALINCTSIDWFHKWPRDALVSVGQRFLQDLDMPADLRTQIAEHMAFVHQSVNEVSLQYRDVEKRYNYTTPKSFLELIAFYRLLLDQQKSSVNRQIARLEKGIAMLKSTQQNVVVLQEQLVGRQAQVSEKAESTAVLIAKTKDEKAKVADEEAKAAKEAALAKAASDEALRIEEQCKKAEQDFQPKYLAAVHALNVLNPRMLNELAQVKVPPGHVKDCAEAVIILNKKYGPKTDWSAAQRMMKDTSRFLNELRNYDYKSVDDTQLAKVKQICTQPWFAPEEMKSSSVAAANLSEWVINIVECTEMWRQLKPLQDQLAEAQRTSEEAQNKLRGVERKVAQMQERLKTVTNALADANAEKARVEGDLADCQQRLSLAKRFVEGLSSEYKRWTRNVQQLQERASTLPGDVLLAAAFVSYIGAFDERYRRQLWKDRWVPDLEHRKIPLQANVDPLRILASPEAFAKWRNEGLAGDRMSLENGAIITQCARWPLLIDPQLQGIRWLRKRFGDKLVVVQLGSKTWMNKIVEAVQTGQTVLIEGVGEELDATLDPVLSRAFFQRGNTRLIRVGTMEVNYHENFRLIIQTKLANPHYKPEVAAQCTLLNFTVTEEGLEEQLLGLVVTREKPELEEKRSQLSRAINEYQLMLNELETELLERLMNAPEDILSDSALVEGLEKTKQASHDIQEKVAQGEKQQEQFDQLRDEYRPVAAEASWLYFLLTSLNQIDHMYQYSLETFQNFFFKGMQRAKVGESIKDRVQSLRESIRLTVFTWVGRGLFEQHKLIFSSQLCFRLMQKGSLREELKPAHYDYLIRGPKKATTDKGLDWLPQSCWQAIVKLAELEEFKKLPSDMHASPNRFKAWYNSPRPEETPLPLDWRKLLELAPFQHLLVVRAMRPDRMTAAMETYVRNALPNGKAFTESDAGRSFEDVLSSTLDDATPVNPVFFILSPGTDPVHFLEVLARKNGYYEKRFHRVALGERQDERAVELLQLAHKEGHWVVLENIHLMPAWVTKLEQLLDEFAVAKSHPDFRVFLSAETSNDPAQRLPIGLLERCIKLTNEPPQGLKLNLSRAFKTLPADQWEFYEPRIKSILFGLCHFHAIVIERGKFGAKGWNRTYPFSIGDLLCSKEVLQNYLDTASSNSQSGAIDKIPWADLRYIFGEILYGGHVTNDWDRLVMKTYLNFYMREELLDEMELFPYNDSFVAGAGDAASGNIAGYYSFRSPPVLAYDQYLEYIEKELAQGPESPVAYGLHPNAEIAVKTERADALFKAIVKLQPRVSGSSTDASKEGGRVALLLGRVAEQTKGITFNIEEIANEIEERGPFHNVFLQECEYLNVLVAEIQRSLAELDLGLQGQLQMSEKMEELEKALFLEQVPRSWAELAYPSQRALGAWVDNLVLRAAQLQQWAEEPREGFPLVTRLDYLFKPQSFLTAILQLYAQKQMFQLDKLTVYTELTRKTTDQIDSRFRDGISAYVSGLYLEGASWNWVTAQMEECKPGFRETASALPVILCKARPVDQLVPGSVYRCPVYVTQKRGNDYVFTATLPSRMSPAKWILAGAAIVLESEDAL